MKNTVIYTLLLCVIFIGCNSDDNNDEGGTDCSTVLCANTVVALQFIDTDTEEDLFLDGGFSLDDLQIVNQDNGESIAFTNNSQNTSVDNIFVFIPDPANEVAQNINYRVILQGTFDFTIRYEITVVEDPCCTDLRFSEFQFDGATIERSESVGQSSNGFIVRI